MCVHTHTLQYDSSHIKVKNSHTETVMFRDICKRGKIKKISRDIIIMNVRRMVTSGGEGEGCD